MNKYVIAITGTPGVGKTSTSRMLASKLDAEIIELGDLIEKKKLFMGIDEKRKTLIADIDKLSKVIGELIKKSNRHYILVVGHFAVDVLSPEIIHKVFVLRRHPEELKVTLESRGYEDGKLWENIAAEILDVCLSEAVELCGVEKVCEIDVTGRRIEDIICLLYTSPSPRD